MREFVMKRLTDKNWVQDVMIELISDVCMVIMGILGAYYLKIYILGF